mmetsp:Transcript_146551/g.408280  ORF Transcript_146551/g.408280 Transcript_146551/m.408280 type:complete len:261 (+) Transcript_146551:729-1511(+)
MHQRLVQVQDERRLGGRLGRLRRQERPGSLAQLRTRQRRQAADEVQLLAQRHGQLLSRASGRGRPEPRRDHGEVRLLQRRRRRHLRRGGLHRSEASAAGPRRRHRTGGVGCELLAADLEAGGACAAVGADPRLASVRPGQWHRRLLLARLKPRPQCPRAPAQAPLRRGDAAAAGLPAGEASASIAATAAARQPGVGELGRGLVWLLGHGGRRRGSGCGRRLRRLLRRPRLVVGAGELQGRAMAGVCGALRTEAHGRWYGC